MFELDCAPATVLQSRRTCRDSLQRATLSRVRETKDDVQLRDAERELQQSLIRFSLI